EYQARHHHASPADSAVVLHNLQTTHVARRIARLADEATSRRSTQPKYDSSMSDRPGCIRNFGADGPDFRALGMVQHFIQPVPAHELDITTQNNKVLPPHLGCSGVVHRRNIWRLWIRQNLNLAS